MVAPVGTNERGTMRRTGRIHRGTPSGFDGFEKRCFTDSKRCQRGFCSSSPRAAPNRAQSRSGEGGSEDPMRKRSRPWDRTNRRTERAVGRRDRATGCHRRVLPHGHLPAPGTPRRFLRRHDDSRVASRSRSENHPASRGSSNDFTSVRCTRWPARIRNIGSSSAGSVSGKYRTDTKVVPRLPGDDMQGGDAAERQQRHLKDLQTGPPVRGEHTEANNVPDCANLLRWNKKYTILALHAER